MSELVIALRRKLAGYEAAGLTEKAEAARWRIAALEAGQAKTSEAEASAGVDLTPAALADVSAEDEEFLELDVADLDESLEGQLELDDNGDD